MLTLSLKSLKITEVLKDSVNSSHSSLASGVNSVIPAIPIRSPVIVSKTSSPLALLLVGLEVISKGGTVGGGLGVKVGGDVGLEVGLVVGFAVGPGVGG